MLRGSEMQNYNFTPSIAHDLMIIKAAQRIEIAYALS